MGIWMGTWIWMAIEETYVDARKCGRVDRERVMRGCYFVESTTGNDMRNLHFKIKTSPLMHSDLSTHETEGPYATAYSIQMQLYTRLY